MVAGLFNSSETYRVLFGFKLGLATGTVSTILGLFSPAIEWWIENLPDRRLGVLGVGLILAGMLFQSIQYWLVVFDLPLR